MATLGSIISSSDLSTKAIKSGTVSVTLSDTTKAITFASNMPSTNYRVFLTPEGNLASTLWPTSKATTGFTLNLSIAVTGSIGWLVIED